MRRNKERRRGEEERGGGREKVDQRASQRLPQKPSEHLGPVASARALLPALPANIIYISKYISIT